MHPHSPHGPQLGAVSFLFTPLPQPGPLRQDLLILNRQWKLRGTIQLSPQGIHFVLAGTPPSIVALIQYLRQIPELQPLQIHTTPVSYPHFPDCLIRVVPELSLIGPQPHGTPPGQRQSVHSAPTPLKTWIQSSNLPLISLLQSTSHPPLILPASTRHQRIHNATHPLPGQTPTNQFRWIHIPNECDGLSLLQSLCLIVDSVPESEWHRECLNHNLLTPDQQTPDLHQIVRAGQSFLHLFPNTREPDVLTHIQILHEDQALVVIHKPAPLPMHSGGRYFLNTLQHFLNHAYHPETLRFAHRLDANTSGLVLATRSKSFAAILQSQFAQRSIHKRYLARVHGAPIEDSFSCNAPISSRSSKLGTRHVDFTHGNPAETHFRVLSRFNDGTSLLEAIPVTGRTNQIRIHLWHLGFPICGDPAYLPNGQLGVRQTLDPSDPPMCLHATEIHFLHPLTLHPTSFTAPSPTWILPPSALTHF